MTSGGGWRIPHSRRWSCQGAPFGKWSNSKWWGNSTSKCFFGVPKDHSLCSFIILSTDKVSESYQVSPHEECEKPTIARYPSLSGSLQRNNFFFGKLLMIKSEAAQEMSSLAFIYVASNFMSTSMEPEMFMFSHSSYFLWLDSGAPTLGLWPIHYHVGLSVGFQGLRLLETFWSILKLWICLKIR